MNSASLYLDVDEDIAETDNEDQGVNNFILKYFQNLEDSVKYMNETNNYLAVLN